MEAQSPRIVSGVREAEGQTEKVAEEKRQTWLTAVQLHELQMQAAAYKYIAAGLVVPVHIVVPIWNSLAFSSWSHYLTMIHRHYSSRLSHKGFNEREMMDPEPTRCRRTDGKKWRCSNDVVPFQKYCERHMHRGRKRSRKHVESSQTNSPAPRVSIKSNDGFHYPTTPSSSKASMVTIASYTESGTLKNNNIVGDKVSSLSCVASASTNKNMGKNDNEESNRFLALGQCELSYDRSEIEPKHRRCQETGEDIVLGQRHASGYLHRGSEILGPCPDLAKSFENSKTVGKGLCQSELQTRSRYLNSKYNTMKWSNINVGSCSLPGMDFSPDTVLQDRGALPFLKSKTENEPGRCHRTDGKKWRCSKDVLPGQKYCCKHMHRGVKKRPEDSNLTSIPYAVATTTESATCKVERARHRGEENGILNARLSLSVPANPSPQGCEDEATVSSSSDTTITDTALKGEDNDELSIDSGV